ncbi:MAG TPA: alpha-amylase family protein [Dyadobacter sp.]|jgi:maltose alpha-D-glucosyltransferase/alpha-amylase|nr:alpha-amylase family protein [Dyadobacter sp.]
MKLHHTTLSILLTILSLPAFAQLKIAPREIKENYWYKNAFIYNLEIGVFQDSDGDGRGDINGLIQRLDYLQMLGVDVIWLAPFQPTPGKDDGYDVADYYTVDPKLGTLGDFAELMHQTKKRGMRVIMDLVINHTSSSHPWFVNARSAKDSKYRDWYIWSEKKPADAEKGMVFPGVQKAVWSLDSVTNQYYYHRFYDFQPDLNFANADVMQEIQRVIGFWLNQGIAGFRLDAVPFIIEVPKSGSEKPQLDFSFLMDLRQFIQSRSADAAILGEANVDPKENPDYFGKNGEGIQMMFNFYANQYLFYGLATSDIKPLKGALQLTSQKPASSQWANFLRNHDEIDLGRLTTKQRQQVYDQFGPDTSMQLYERGIRRRLAPMLKNNPEHIEMAYSLLFSLPGAAVIRYGEELGMGDDLSLKERIAVRTPMQWNTSKNAGFTTADTAFRPVISDTEYGFHTLNIEQQWRDDKSLLRSIAEMVRVRKSCPEIGLGEFRVLKSNVENVLIAEYSYKGKRLITVHNFSDKPASLNFEMKNAGKLNDLWDKSQDKTVTNGNVKLEMAAYGYNWYRVDQVLP